MSAHVKLKKILTPEKIDQILHNEETNFFGFFIKHYRFTYLILIAIFLAGFYAMFTLPRESDPEVKIPYAMVTTIYPGANPNDTEELLTNKIEDKIKNLENLKKYTSSSGVGVSSVFVEFSAEADMQDSMQKLREAIDLAKPNLPQDAEDPMVSQLNFSDQALITYSLVGEGFSEPELKNYADILQEKLEGIKDVSRAPIIGGLEREFQVVVNQSQLLNFNLSLGQVVNAIARTNFNLPAGNIDVDGYKYNVRVQGKFNNAESLNDIVIAGFNDTPIYLRDVAQIKDTYKEKGSASRVGVEDNIPSNTVSLQIYKKTGGNILKMVDEANLLVEEIKTSASWPEGLDILKTNDLAVFVRDDFNTLGSSAVQTMFLIIIILSIAIGLRASIIASLSVPIAFLMAFIVLMMQGMTLNSMVLFSLVLSLGLMVDNSIIIIEGISEYMGKYNISAYKAAQLSVWNYRWPVIAGTMTTVAAFAPMLLVSGILGEYLATIPKTIMATLLSSLFVALVILPTMAGRLIKKTLAQEQYQDDYENNSNTKHFINRNVEKLKEKYAEFMKKILPHKKKRRMVIATAWFVFIISALIPVIGLMKIEMFPKVDIDFIVINMELPAGSILEKTDEVASSVEKIIVEQIPELDNYVTNIGNATSMGMDSSSSGSHIASVTINLKEGRARKSYEIAESLRPFMKNINGAEVTVEELSAGPPSGAPIEARVYGKDIKELANSSSEVKDVLKNIKGLINIKDSLQDSTGEFTFLIDRQKANYYSLDVASIASILRNAIYGSKASAVLLNGEDIDITVKYAKEKFNNISDLENLLISTPKGPTPLKNIANVKLEPSLLSIGHRDGENIITLSAYTEEGVDLKRALAEFDAKQKELNLPVGMRIEVGGETEDIEQSFTETFESLIIAIILIAFILVLQFNSFKQPFIIIFTLPLAIPGVILGLTILMQPFSFPAFIGIVALAGIVVNDAIVLIDKINKEIANGVEFIEAIIDGGVSRMQPIFLTSLTTIAGILPLYFANEVWRGLSITVASGLAFSTVLTLIVVPVMYASICRKDYEKMNSK